MIVPQKLRTIGQSEPPAQSRSTGRYSYMRSDQPVSVLSKVSVYPYHLIRNEFPRAVGYDPSKTTTTVEVVLMDGQQIC
jgi:hypothetical protein